MYFLENHDLIMFSCVNISVLSCLPAQMQSILLFAGSVEVDSFFLGFSVVVDVGFLFVVVSVMPVFFFLRVLLVLFSSFWVVAFDSLFHVRMNFACFSENLRK